MAILLTNDDGISAMGIAVLADALQGLDELLIVAPDRNCSGVGHAITFDRPLQATEHKARNGNPRLAVDGTPADAARYGIRHVSKTKPTLVVSGINEGLNIGINVFHSGTIGAALEAVFCGVSSVAVSVDARGVPHWDTAAHFARETVRLALEAEKARTAGIIVSRPFCLNVNIPDLPRGQVKGIRYTHHGQFGYGDYVRPENETPPARSGSDPSDPHHMYDIVALHKGYVSVTPLQIDMTHHALRDFLKNNTDEGQTT